MRTCLLSEIFYDLVFPNNEVRQNLQELFYLIVTEVFPHVVALETKMACFNKVFITWIIASKLSTLTNCENVINSYFYEVFFLQQWFFFFK